MAVLETSSPSKTRENSKKMAKNDKKQPKKVLIVAQELKLARILAGNNKTARDRALKSLKKWFQNRSATIPFTDNDFLRLWKGLFYSMWMSDKPLIQEECAESISSLLHSLPLETSLLFYKCGMRILMNEWFGIDQLRLDKFLMFVRRLLRQVLFVLKKDNWSRKSVQKFSQCLSETILDTGSHRPMGLLMHCIEIFPEELAKVADGGLQPQLVTEFLIPFIKQLAFNDDSRITDHIRKHIFYHLIRQSDLGLEYDEKYQAWRSLGFPGSIDSMKKIDASDEEPEDVEEEEEEDVYKVYDPRAGRVDVELPRLKFHSKAIAKALSEYKFTKNTNSKTRKCLNDLSEQFKKLASGVYPLGVKTVKLATNSYDTSLKKAVNRLVKFDKKIKGQKKSRKRKPQEDLIELRNGKKVKLDKDTGLQEKLLKNMKQKRKNLDYIESPPEKLKKFEIESIFRRNSGTWLVSKTEPGKENSERFLFPRNEFEVSDGNIEATETLRQKEINLHATLIKNPFASPSPTKKVKINTKLNRSQDVQEHHAQILSSPAIPYDANKKPAKPLLKTPVKRSPINPFYGLS